jgi:hypothetical protein
MRSNGRLGDDILRVVDVTRQGTFKFLIDRRPVRSRVPQRYGFGSGYGG